MMLSQRDTDVVWHPFTQHKLSDLPIPIKAGKGSYLIDYQGNSYLDLISSWWVNLHGHANEKIAQAIYQQACTLEHVIFSGFTHEPAVQLAEEILSLLPSEFTKVFYTDNGSTAIEAALKMTYQYWRNHGQSQRTRFISFKDGYHGDTFGAMSVGKKSGFFSHFEELFFEVDTFEYPSTWLNDENILQKEEKTLQQLTIHFEKYPDQVAAVIIEPLVQGAGGMNMCRSEFLQKLHSLAKEHNTLIIYDEVMTGFGRAGDYFACLKANTVPDIICVAKGITGGFLPLAATLCREKIYQAFLGNSFHQALAHGHSYTANPLGCAAGLASLALLKDKNTHIAWKMLESVHIEKLSELEKLPFIEKIRYCGTIAAINIKKLISYGSTLSLELRNSFLKRGLLIRPLGNVIYFLPPYCITENELRKAYDIVIEELNRILNELVISTN